MEVLLFLAAHARENSHVKRHLRELRGSVSFLMQYIFGRFCISSRSLYSFRLYRALVTSIAGQKYAKKAIHVFANTEIDESSIMHSKYKLSCRIVKCSISSIG